MRKSASLFDPRLKLKWSWKGTHVLLIHNGKAIWDSRTLGEVWETETPRKLAEGLSIYMDTPVAQLKRREVALTIEPPMTGYYNNNPTAQQQYVTRQTKAYRRDWGALWEILLAADRRIGKSKQSVWLFQCDNQAARNISGERC